MNGSAGQGYQADSENGLCLSGKRLGAAAYTSFCLIGLPTQDLLKST